MGSRQELKTNDATAPSCMNAPGVPPFCGATKIMTRGFRTLIPPRQSTRVNSLSPTRAGPGSPSLPASIRAGGRRPRPKAEESVGRRHSPSPSAEPRVRARPVVPGIARLLGIAATIRNETPEPHPADDGSKNHRGTSWTKAKMQKTGHPDSCRGIRAWKNTGFREHSPNAVRANAGCKPGKDDTTFR